MDISISSYNAQGAKTSTRTVTSTAYLSGTTLLLMVALYPAKQEEGLFLFKLVMPKAANASTGAVRSTWKPSTVVCLTQPYGRKLQMFLNSKSVCSGQASLAWSNVM